MPKTREVVLTARVTVPHKMSDQEAARLVQRLVMAGEEDAANSPPDWEDPDKDKIAAITAVKIDGAPDDPMPR